MDKKVYVVCWGSSGMDDDCNAHAYTGVHGVYISEEKAKKGLEECKDECYNDVVFGPEYDDEAREQVKQNTHVYGSVNENYFEIDYTIGDNSCEIYITLVEKEIV